jgi:hypothetical protein
MNKKRDILKSYLKKALQRKKAYQKKYLKLKKADDITNSVFTGLSAITTTSIILTFTGNPITLIVACVSGSIGSVGIATCKAYGLKHKVDLNKSGLDNYAILERELRLILTNFSKYESDDLDFIINDLNNRFALLEDNLSPAIISISEDDITRSPLI